MRITFISALTACLILVSGAAWAVPVTYGANGHEYDVIFSSGIEWVDAALSAGGQGEGWELATITGQEEQDFVAALIRDLGSEFWLGGFQIPGTMSATEDWAWITGEDWSYTHWNPGEPNDVNGAGSEQFLAMWASGGWDYWNDEGNLGNISGYVIENSTAPVPEPASLVLIGSGLLGLAGLRRKLKK
jgi:hypothetical protein